MFGDTENIRTKTEDDVNNSGCYGGFGNRFSYEQCCRAENISGKRIKIALFAAGLCMLSVSLVFLCAIVLIRIVESNRQLYYPGAVYYTESLRGSETEVPLKLSERTVPLSEQDEMLVSVSSEDSQRYRIPVGVMIRSLDPHSEASLSGLEAGDIIVAVNGSSVSDIESLSSLVSEDGSQSFVRLTVFRDNSYYIVSVNAN